MIQTIYIHQIPDPLEDSRPDLPELTMELIDEMDRIKAFLNGEGSLLKTKI